MELKEARYILAIARQGSIGKAAESLFISQPSLSKYLKNLENQLGGPLFYRRDNCYTPVSYTHLTSSSLITLEVKVPWVWIFITFTLTLEHGLSVFKRKSSSMALLQFTEW